MPQGIWAIVACALACAPSAAAQTPPAPAQDAPVVVAGTRVTMAQARARAGTEAGTYGIGEGCALGYAGDASKWGAFVDLADTVFEGRVVGTCDDEADRARARLRAYLRHTAPDVLRRTRFDIDCRPQTLQTRRRGDLFVVLHAIARIAAHVRRD